MNLPTYDKPTYAERNPPTMRFSVAILLFAGVVAPAQGAESTGSKTAIDSLDCRWTFGNHEPISMYRRTGGFSTGGIEGGALWLRKWHHWFDSEACPQLMQDLGLNFVHSHFYKGMGWQYESRDFPVVKQFVENCHKHDVRALAYIQFSTLYYETMLSEVPRPGRLGCAGRTRREAHLARPVLPLGPVPQPSGLRSLPEKDDPYRRGRRGLRRRHVRQLRHAPLLLPSLHEAVPRTPCRRAEPRRTGSACRPWPTSCRQDRGRRSSARFRTRLFRSGCGFGRSGSRSCSTVCTNTRSAANPQPSSAGISPTSAASTWPGATP